MTIAITALGVLVPVRTLEERWPGGPAAYMTGAPNATARTDGALVAIDFMTPADVQVWVEGELASRGLAYVREGRAADVAIVDARRGPCAPCDWIWFEPATGHGRATLVGAPQSEPVWPDGYSSDEPPELEYVEDSVSCMGFQSRDRGGVACFIDERSGKERYLGATSDDVLEGLLSDRLRALWERVERYRKASDQGQDLSPDAAQAVNSVAAEAERILAACPSLAEHASYVAGLAARVGGEFERALRHWQRFVELEPRHAGAFMELTWCCSELGRHDEALVAAQRAVALVADDAGALANMGLVLLNLGRLNEAGGWIDRALAVNPDDPSP